jgi:lipopolysaccharide assembly protein A
MGEMLQIIGAFFFIFLLVLGLGFALLNASPVELNYYFGRVELPLAFALVLTLATGTLLGLLGTLNMVFKLKRENMKLKKIIKASERELTQLRALPVKDRH